MSIRSCSLRCKMISASVACAIACAAGYWFIDARTAMARSPLGASWSPSDLRSMDDILHRRFDVLLKRYVDSDGYVKYSDWHSSEEDRRQLQQYLKELSQADLNKPASHEARLAFWINAYNAVTIEGILQEYPTDSIRNHTSRLGGYNIWKDLPLKVGGRSYSLDAIEHQILRKMSEPRIHFAIVCASVGCPRLLNEAYTSERVNEQLALNARDFFSRTQNLRLEPNGTLQVSSILKWFGADFGSSEEARIGYLQTYFPTQIQQQLGRTTPNVTYLNYDWSLNDQSSKPAAASK